MKIVIDIPEIPTNDKQRWALANGTPYPHGEWKQVGEMTYKCTKCGWLKKTGLMPYCENCGSDNRPREEDRSHGEWKYAIVDCYKSGYICPHCNGFAVIDGKSDSYSVTFCPNCGSNNRPKEGEVE